MSASGSDGESPDRGDGDSGASGAATLRREGDRWAVEGDGYRLSGAVDGAVAVLDDAEGDRWAELRLLASVDSATGDDETFAVSGPSVEKMPGSLILTWALRSSQWAAKRLVITATRPSLSVRVEVEGTGRLTTVSLLAGRVVQARASGFLMSGAWFESIVAASPGDPGRVVTPASESASCGVVSGSEAGRGRWFFTPAPFVWAASHAVPADPMTIPGGPWLGFALDAVRGAAGFTGVAYRAVDRGFGFEIDYDGHTDINGSWSSPALVIAPASDPFAAIAAQRTRLASAGSTPERKGRGGRTGRPIPPWWLEPIFCGWGAQCADAAAAGLPMAVASARSTQAAYDGWLAHLAARGIVPGTIALDDKWQATYGANEPDTGKWPDLHGWIAARHAADQRVLLWYKAWDAEGWDPAWSVRTTAGDPIGVDPTNPDAEAAIRRSVRSMLGADGLDADGLKIDFTARTPSGRATVHHGTAWGVDLLALLLEIVADEATAAKPDALLVAHTPNPIVAPAVGMIRLNDALRLDDPRPDVDVVSQMRFRAAVARAACPGLPIDTDDWCMPNLATWRAYLAVKAGLGIPALYYATHIDRTGEEFEDADYALIRDVWAHHREAVGLPPRHATRA
jgi:hypothetical protein